MTELVRICDRIIKIRITLSAVTVTAISAYSPHSRLTDAQKSHLYESLPRTTSMAKNDNIIMAGGRGQWTCGTTL